MEYLFLGLGNPSDAYRGTRHNVGKDFVEGLVRHAGLPWRSADGYRTASVPFGARTAVCAVSDGFMNDTGAVMRVFLRSVPPERMLVIHDDIAFPAGTVRLSRGGSSGGHNGVASVADAAGTDDFLRLRIGVGVGKPLESYVLAPVPDGDRDLIAATLRASVPDTLSRLLDADVARAMQLCNSAER